MSCVSIAVSILHKLLEIILKFNTTENTWEIFYIVIPEAVFQKQYLSKTH